MIKIKICDHNNKEFEFKYYGSIKLAVIGPFLIINVYKIDKTNGVSWDKTTHDWFWLSEVISIRGEQ